MENIIPTIFDGEPERPCARQKSKLAKIGAREIPITVGVSVRADEPYIFIVADGLRWQAAGPGHFADIHAVLHDPFVRQRLIAAPFLRPRTPPS